MTPAALPVLAPRERRPGGCCSPVVEPDLGAEEAAGLAARMKALADPTRLRIVDALRKASPEAICQCELTPLFDMSQQALSRHLKILTGAGVIGAERRGLWTYYFTTPDGLAVVRAWIDA